MTPNHATLQGVLNPHHSSTTYYFEYGTTVGYGTSVPRTQDADAGSEDGVETEQHDGPEGVEQLRCGSAQTDRQGSRGCLG